MYLYRRDKGKGSSSSHPLVTSRKDVVPTFALVLVHQILLPTQHSQSRHIFIQRNNLSASTDTLAMDCNTPDLCSHPFCSLPGVIVCDICGKMFCAPRGMAQIGCYFCVDLSPCSLNPFLPADAHYDVPFFEHSMANNNEFLHPARGVQHHREMQEEMGDADMRDPFIRATTGLNESDGMVYESSHADYEPDAVFEGNPERQDPANLPPVDEEYLESMLGISNNNRYVNTGDDWDMYTITDEDWQSIRGWQDPGEPLDGSEHVGQPQMERFKVSAAKGKGKGKEQNVASGGDSSRLPTPNTSVSPKGEPRSRL